MNRPSKGQRLKLIAKCVARNWLTYVQFHAGMKDSDIGTTHRRLPVTESVAYIRRVFDDYLQFAGVDVSALTGRRILEIGPGDNSGVAMMFLAHGATQVVSLDKFVSRHDPSHQAAIYAALLQTLSPAQRKALEAVGPTDTIPPAFDTQRLQVIHGQGIEHAHQLFPAEHFDFIVSRAVLEEVFTIREAFDAMRRLLRAGGALIHKIDLSDYGLLSDRGYHPLEFLTIPELIYTSMCSNSGLPNRRRIHYYRELMKEYGFRFDLHVTRTMGRSGEFGPGESAVKATEITNTAKRLVEDIRPRLARPFRLLPDEDLMTLGVFLVGWKPQDKVQPGDN